MYCMYIWNLEHKKNKNVEDNYSWVCSKYVMITLALLVSEKWAFIQTEIHFCSLGLSRINTVDCSALGGNAGPN